MKTFNKEKYNDVADIIEIYLTKEDFFKKGSTVYQVRMEVVSDNNNFVEEWQPGLKVYYINNVAAEELGISVDEFMKKVREV